jgi:hypothetical protein
MFMSNRLPLTANVMHGLLLIITSESYQPSSCSTLYFVPRYITETKEKGERFKYKPQYTEITTQLSNRKISIKHDVNVIHSISHLIRANECRNIQFINGVKKLEALLVFADYSSAKSEIGFRKWTPHTDPSPHSPQIIWATHLQSSTTLRSV